MQCLGIWTSLRPLAPSPDHLSERWQVRQVLWIPEDLTDFFSDGVGRARIGRCRAMFVRRHDLEVLAMIRSTVTVEEAAVILGISRSSAYECVHRGELRAVRLGRRLVVPRSVLAEMLGAERPQQPCCSDSKQPS